MAIAIDPSAVTALRLHRHTLDRRADRASLQRIVAVRGIEDVPPGSAAVTLAARVVGFGPADLERAVFDERSLVRVPSARGAPFIVPAADLAVFTPGCVRSTTGTRLRMRRAADAVASLVSG